VLDPEVYPKTLVFAGWQCRFKLILTNAGSDASARFLLPR
jgi:hypothetical protein